MAKVNGPRIVAGVRSPFRVPAPFWVPAALGLWAVACVSQPLPTSTPVSPSIPPPTITPDSPLEYTFNIVNTYPHDPAAFTQGLVFKDGYLYEGTGLRGQSTLRKVDLTTGEVIQSLSLDPNLHGEGITLFNDRIAQLTFTSGIGFIYDQQSFARIGDFSYTPEGWGLTHDGRQLIMSDGTAELRFLDAETFEEIARITVTDRGQPLQWLNELEYVEGEIYANVWLSDMIARISPDTGEVLGWIDLSGLLDIALEAGVLNGIAYDSETGRLFVTGKNWPKLFEIALVRE
jgi:glutamine cyclotransferase